MVDKVELSAEERALLKALRDQLSVSYQWIPARIGLARSLQLADPPSKTEFKAQPQREDGTSLHPKQMTGEGESDPENDLTDVFRALLSVYEGRDLFRGERDFNEALQRHVRRGIAVVSKEWEAAGTFVNYLGQELLYDAGATALSPTEDDLPERIMRVTGELGIGAALESVDRGPRLTRLTLRLHDFEDLERLRGGLEKIIFALGLGQDALTLGYADEPKQVYLTAPRPKAAWKTVTWSELKSTLYSEAAKSMGLPICLGVDVLGEPFLIDLVEAPHLLVGGTTGSGKSVCLHTILLSILEGSHGRPDLVLIDPKEVEFSAYAGSARVRGGVKFEADALETLEGLVTEMEQRQERFRHLGVRDFGEAKARDASLERIVVVIDELNALIMHDKAIEIPLIRLAQKARFSGIHLVVATQRPEAATLSGQLRSNIPSRIALTVQKGTESKIILDEVGAEALLGRGDMLVKFSGQPVKRAHGCRVDHVDIQAAVAS